MFLGTVPEEWSESDIRMSYECALRNGPTSPVSPWPPMRLASRSSSHFSMWTTNEATLIHPQLSSLWTCWLEPRPGQPSQPRSPPLQTYPINYSPCPFCVLLCIPIGGRCASNSAARDEAFIDYSVLQWTWIVGRFNQLWQWRLDVRLDLDRPPPPLDHKQASWHAILAEARDGDDEGVWWKPASRR